MNITEISNIMDDAKKIHFVGVGGISMSSLAAITKEQGYQVTGSDRIETALTQKLSKQGIDISYGHKAENVEGSSLIVYTAAVHSDNVELSYAEKRKIPTCSRADYLGWLMSKYKNRIGVAGTHGKSTITSMLAEIFIAAGANPTVISGAELTSMGGAYRIGGDEYFIFEACEYCDSFLSFIPTTAIISNIEYDHADYFKTMDHLRNSFVKYAECAENVLICSDDKESVNLKERFGEKTVTFGFTNSDYSSVNLTFENGFASFDIICNQEVLCHITLSVPGKHNVLNALAAAAIAFMHGVSSIAVSEGLRIFKGAARRFEYMGTTKKGAAVYNDYAHHPSEIKATLSAAKEFGKRIISVFQPHTFSRTANLFEEFCDSFYDSDITVLADIYAAREINTFGISSEALAEKIKNGFYFPTFENIAEYLDKISCADDLILILGAGDIVKLGNMILSEKDGEMPKQDN